VTRLEIEYLKKARGTITARADVSLPPIDGPMELHPEASLTDADGDLVARARVILSPTTNSQRCGTKLNSSLRRAVCGFYTRPATRRVHVRFFVRPIAP
jgi:hypothetical protein